MCYYYRHHFLPPNLINYFCAYFREHFIVRVAVLFVRTFIWSCQINIHLAQI